MATPFRLGLVIVALASTLACSLNVPNLPQNPTNPPDAVNEAALPPVVTLANPLAGAVYLEGVAVNILARVTNAGEDIDRVEVVVDGAIVSTLPVPNPAGAPSFSVAQTWTAEGNGPHTIGVTVFRSDGSSSAPVSQTIEVVDPNAVLVEAAPGDEAPSPPETTDDADTVETVDDGSAEAAEPPTQPTEPPTEAATDEPTSTPEPTASPTPSVPIATFVQGANIRTGPNQQFDRIGGFAAGTETEALAVTSDGQWYKIRYFNGEGWVFSDLVSVSNSGALPIDDGPPLPTATPIPPTATPVPAPQSNLAFNADPSISPFPPDCGETMSITVSVVNTGPESLGTGSAMVIRDRHVDSGLVTETRAPIPDITSQGVATISDVFLTVDTNFDSRHVIEIVLDADNQITESNEDDNLYASAEYTLEKGDC